MLHSRNIYSILAQTISSDSSPDRSIVSSILITLSGQAIASCHSSRPPPPAKTSPATYQFLHDYENNLISPNGIVRNRPTFPRSHDINDPNSSPVDTSIPNRNLDCPSHLQGDFHVSRSGKTKLYALFASSAWKTYQQAGMSKHVLTPSAVKPLSSPCSDGIEEIASSKASKKSKNKPRNLAHRNNQILAEKQDNLVPNTSASSDNERDWIFLTTEDASANGATIFIMKLELIESKKELLLVLIGDGDCPMGIILKKARETAAVLEKGLSSFVVPE